MKPLIFAGRSHPHFAQALASTLSSTLARREIHPYSDGETYVRILEPSPCVCASKIGIVQTGCSPVHDHVVELLLLADAIKKMGAPSITAIMPFLPYRRQEHIHEEGEGIGGELMMKLCKTAGITDILTADLHHVSFTKFFGNKLKEISALTLFVAYFKPFTHHTVIVSPDEGGIARAEMLAQALQIPMFHIAKKRLRHDKVEIRRFRHTMSFRRAIIVDDEINTGGTIISCAHALHAQGIRDIRVAATHGIFSGRAIPLLKKSPIREIIVTDTIPLSPEKKSPSIKTLSIVPLFAKMLQ